MVRKGLLLQLIGWTAPARQLNRPALVPADSSIANFGLDQFSSSATPRYSGAVC